MGVSRVPRSRFFEGVCLNYRHPDPRRVWKGGPEWQSMTPDPRLPLLPVLSSKSAELAVKNNAPDPLLCDREAWIDEIWPGAKVGEGWGGFAPHTPP